MRHTVFFLINAPRALPFTGPVNGTLRIKFENTVFLQLKDKGFSILKQFQSLDPSYKIDLDFGIV